MMIIKH